MKKTEMELFLKPLGKKDLKKLIKLAEKQLNSNMDIGDTVTLTIEYMIGDADGDTEESTTIHIDSQDELDAISVITHILDNHTEPNKDRCGFILDMDNFSKKPDDVYNILYEQDEAPETYNGIKLNPKILEIIGGIVDDCFYGETEYSFLVYEGYKLEQ